MNKRVVAVVSVVVAAAIIGGGLALWRSGFLSNLLLGESIGELTYEETQEGNRSYKEETDLFRIEATYPNTAHLTKTAGESADKNAVSEMEDFVKSEVAAFKETQDFEHLTDRDKEILGFAGGRKYELGVSFTEYESPVSVSFAFALYQDTGGAHPNGYFKTFVWKKTGQQVMLEDLFTIGSPYLERLSAESRRQLVESLATQGVDGTALFEEGLSPKEENFEKFYLHEGELIIIFDPYQVAAYAAGPQAVHIPLSQIQDILKPDFRQ